MRLESWKVRKLKSLKVWIDSQQIKQIGQRIHPERIHRERIKRIGQRMKRIKRIN